MPMSRWDWMLNIAGKVYALDSSTIDLCLSLFDGEDANLVCHLHLRVDRHREKGAGHQIIALHLSTDFVGVSF
jgi:hypothetical protein